MTEIPFIVHEISETRHMRRERGLLLMTIVMAVTLAGRIIREATNKTVNRGSCLLAAMGAGA